MGLYIRTLKKQSEILHNWDAAVWTVMVEKAIAHRNNEITFDFKEFYELCLPRSFLRSRYFRFYRVVSSVALLQSLVSRVFVGL